MNWNAVWGFLIAAYWFIKRWYDKLEPVLLPIIKEAEQRAIDGKIDLVDRKAIVMKGIGFAEAQGKIKLNFIEKLIVSKVVDIIAQKLPDITIKKEAGLIVDNAISLIPNKEAK